MHYQGERLNGEDQFTETHTNKQQLPLRYGIKKLKHAVAKYIFQVSGQESNR